MTRCRLAALTGLALSTALVGAAGGGALVVILPAWLVGLALRYDNHTGSLTFAAVALFIVVLVMLALVALAALHR